MKRTDHCDGCKSFAELFYYAEGTRHDGWYCRPCFADTAALVLVEQKINQARAERRDASGLEKQWQRLSKRFSRRFDEMKAARCSGRKWPQ